MLKIKGIRSLNEKELLAVKEFEKIMKEQVIPNTIKVMKEREAAWQKIKDLPLY